MAIATLSVRLLAEMAEFRADFKEAQRGVEQFQQGFQATATKASAFGNLIAIGVANAAGSLANLAGEILGTASRIDDLSKRTGLSTDTIQEFQHVAQQTGATVDAFANAAFNLGTRLAGGGDSVEGAVRALGLSFSDLQRLSPDEQFKRIARALHEVESQQERNRLGLLLFGRDFKSIAAAIAEGHDQIAAGASKMSAESIKRLAEAEDAWTRLRNTVVIHSGEILGGMLSVIDNLKKGGDELGNFTRHLGTVGFAGAFAQESARLKAMADDAERMNKALAQTPDIGNISFARPGQGSNRPNQFGNVDTEAELKRLEEAQKKAQKAADDHTQAVRRLRDEFSGAKLAADVRNVSQAFHALTDEQRNNTDVQLRVAEAAQRLQEQGAALTPELFQLTLQTGLFHKELMAVNPTLDLTGVGFQVLGSEIQQSAQHLIDFAEILDDPRLRAVPGLPRDLPGFEIPPPSIPEPLPPTFWQQFLGVNGPTFMQTARRAADDVVAALANAIGTGDWKSVLNTVGRAFRDVLAAGIAAGVNALVPGLGTLLQPLFSAVVGFVGGLFDRNKGRDLVESFADSLGGFDALHVKLNELGAEGERLWIQLTQGVGRNNPDQARRAIEAVTAALEEQKRKQQEAGNASVAAAQKIRDSQDAATSALKSKIADLGREYDRLFESIRDEAPEEVMGIVEQQTRARMEQVRQEQVETQNALDAVLQSLQESFADVGEAAVQAARTIQDAFNGIRINPVQVDFSGGDGGSAPSAPTSSYTPESGSSTVVLNMDGRTVAEASVPWIPDVVREYGLA